MPPTVSCRAWVAVPAVARTGVADRERDRLVGVQVDRDDPLGDVGLGVLGQRVLVERHGELLAEQLDRGAGQVDREGAVRLGDGLTDHVAGRVLDGRRVTPATGAWGSSRRSQIRPRIEIVSSSVAGRSSQDSVLSSVGAAAAAADPPSTTPSRQSSATRMTPTPAMARGARVCMGLPMTRRRTASWQRSGRTLAAGCGVGTPSPAARRGASP